MPTKTVKLPYQKNLNRIAKTKLELQANHEYFKENAIRNKLYKQYKDLAQAMVDSVQYVINHRGAYENAGQSEILEFETAIVGNGFNYQEITNLKELINRKVDNLRY